MTSKLKEERMIEFREFSFQLKKKQLKQQNWHVYAYSREIVTNPSNLELNCVYMENYSIRKISPNKFKVDIIMKILTSQIFYWKVEFRGAGKRRPIQKLKG